MNYRLYKKFFSGSFFPVTDPNHLVNLESTGEFSVRSITGSGANTKRANHYLPSTIGLTNMLNGFTGGSRFEALSSHSNFFIPEIYDCTSYTGVQKAIVNYFMQREKPCIITVQVEANAKVTFKSTYEDSNLYIDWGTGTFDHYNLKATYSTSHTYTEGGTYQLRLKTMNEAIEVTVTSGNILSITAPFFTNILTSATSYFAVNKVEGPIARATINVNSSVSPYDGVEELQFGVDGKNINIQSGIADWCALDKYIGVTTITLNCSNLYFDWADLSFTNPLSINVFPNEMTIKTAADYFSRQTYTTKPTLTILKGIGQDKWYQYCVDNYSDKFASIVKA